MLPSLVFAQSRPAFCYDGATDLCQQALDAWNASMYNDNHRYYCTSAGEYLGWTEGHYLKSFAFGYLATKDTHYLDKLRQHIDGAICRDTSTFDVIDCPAPPDDSGVCCCRFTQQDQGGVYDPEWGWYSANDYSLDGTEFDLMVGEGITIQGVTMFIEAVYNDPSLHAEYKSDADYYLNLLETELIPKWDRRQLWEDVKDGEGVYKYHDHPGHLRVNMTLATNQMMEFIRVLLNMWRITGNEWYRDRAAKGLYHIKKNFWVEDGTINWNYWDFAGIWDYEDDGQLKHWVGEDHRCGYKELNTEAIIEGYRNCLVYDDADVQATDERFQLWLMQHPSLGCGHVSLLGFYNESALEESFYDIQAEPASWGNLQETPKFIYALDSLPEDKFYDVCSDIGNPIALKFDGSTTDFSSVTDIQNVQNPVLEVSPYGKIGFTGYFNLANENLDAYITIEDNLIGIESSEIPDLNVPATVTLYGLDFPNPIIMKNGIECVSCSVIENVPGSHIKFTIPEADYYWVTSQSRNIYFFDDFETGDFTSWSGGHALVEVTNEDSFSGTYSMKSTFDGIEQHFYVSNSYDDFMDYWEQVSFKLSDDFQMSEGDKFDFGAQPSSGWVTSNSINIGYSDARYFIWFDYNSIFPLNRGSHRVPGSGLRGIEIDKGKWYTLEIHMENSDPEIYNGYVDVFLDGRFMGRSKLGNTSISHLGSLRLGVQYADAGTTGAIYYDDFTLADEYIGGDFGNTCSSLGGECCTTGQECQGGSFTSSSDCGNSCCTGTCSTPVANFLPEQFIEAEDGELTSPMLTGTNSSASGGQYVYTSTTNQGSVTFTFDIQLAGHYMMEARILTPAPNAGGHNSLFVGLDSEAAQGNEEYTFDTVESEQFIWDDVSLRGPGGSYNYSEYDPMIWDLTQGTHNFTFYGREASTWIDQIILRKAHHRSDTDADGCIDTGEMVAFMDRWKISSADVGMVELMESIGLWKSGTGCS